MSEYEINYAPRSNNLEKVNEGYKLLKKRAAEGNMYYYSDFYNALGLGKNLPITMGAQILADISIYTQEESNHMLSAIVISKGNKLIGEGFFDLAIELGVLTKDATEEEKQSFWAEEFRKCKSYWAKHVENTLETQS